MNNIIFWNFICSLSFVGLTSIIWSVAYEMSKAKNYNLEQSIKDSERYIKALIIENRTLKIKKIQERHENYDLEILEDIENGFSSEID